MKKFLISFCAGALISALGAACNDAPQDPVESGLGEEIPGMEIRQATGTVIGSYANGFGSLLLQVDEKYSIGNPIEYYYPSGYNVPSWHLQLPDVGTYLNMIQVQDLPNVKNKRISFSYRVFQSGKDDELFIEGNGKSRLDTAPPNVPVYVITNYEFLDD